MKNINDSTEFYDLLYQLEDLDQDWFLNVGTEAGLNHYIDDGNIYVGAKTVGKERQLLKKLRKCINVGKRDWRNQEEVAAIRLSVTFYKNFGLSNREVSLILNVSESTLRHDYPALRPNEKITTKLKLEEVNIIE